MCHHQVFVIFTFSHKNIFFSFQGNDYSSYHNTLGHHRAGTLLPNASPSSAYNKYSYATDLSLSSNSHYGYTSWGLWRGGTGTGIGGTDSRNISPSIYSHHNSGKKRRRNIKSFSILLMSAAMIVVLAVLAVAGLAFYFSTFRSDQSDSILIFDSTMSVTKGDIFTASLKNPQSLAYQQKSTFYERLLKNALEHAGLTVAKINISSFGDGPFINLTFRVFLDMRKIQVTINNVEEHIKHAFLNEIALPVPEYKDLFVNPDSIHIKRLLDKDVLQSASFIHPPPDTNSNGNDSPKIIEQGKSQNTKKAGIIERPLQKISSSSPKIFSKPNTKPVTTDKPLIHEPDIDLDSLTVIQGSFEVTKTEADITRNRESLKTTSTLKPFMISPASIKISDNNKKTVGNRGNNTSTTGKIEKTSKISTVTVSSTKKGSVVKTSTTTTMKPTQRITTTTPTVKSTTSNIGSTEKMIDTTVDQTKKIQVKNSEMGPNKPKPGSIGMQVLKDLLKTEIVGGDFIPDNKNASNNVPKLDLNLFTNSPVIDEEPWHPINPNTPKIETSTSSIKEGIANKNENETDSSLEKNHSVKKDSPPPLNIKDELLMYRNKMPALDSIEQSYVDSSGGLIYYKAFNNPGFTERTSEIEHLGAMDVRPYPLPVNKLTDDPTQFAYDLTDTATPASTVKNYTVNQDKFEYLGGGVIVKRPEITSTTMKSVPSSTTETASTKTTSTTEVPESESEEEEEDDNSKILGTPDKNINDTYFGENKLESRAGDSDIEAIGSGEKLSIVNLKDYIMQNKFKPTEKPSTAPEEIKKPVTEPTLVTSTADTSSVWSDAPQLFPIGSKWEFVNGTRVTPFENMGMRKVYNETLQALVVENSQPPVVSDESLDEMKVQKQNLTDVNLPGISSIFDTIASKIGIEQEVSSKAPPFSMQNKKVTQAMSSSTTTTTTTSAPTTTRKLSTKRLTTTSTTKRPVTTTTKRPSTSTKRGTTSPRIIYKQTTTAPKLITVKTTTRAPPTTSTSTTTNNPNPIIYRTSDASPTYYDTSSETMFMGQAEVEVVDPNAYEEILKQSQVMSSSTTPVHTTTPRNPPLVTLLPVKSNSGIRNFSRDKLKHSPGMLYSASSGSSQDRVSNKSFNSRGPIFTDNLRESVVKTSMNVEV
uniref:CSON003106 protein n=1 Tax=Culicoides sonorensis TaxID=179676 RepID=A0A336L367_CULSO